MLFRLIQLEELNSKINSYKEKGDFDEEISED